MTEGLWTKLGVLVAAAGVLATVMIAKGHDSVSQISVPVSLAPPFQPAPPPPPVDHVSGSYTGECLNTTYNVGCGLKLVITKDRDGKLSGSINILGQLVGSSNIEGFSDGSRVSFTSRDTEQGSLITWTGMLEGNTLKGSYVVSVPGSLKATLGDQQGIWEVRRD
jgi:hypothetical protein